MRSYRGQHNQVAVSANSRETGINTPQDLDTSMLVAEGDVLNLKPRRETNADELTGKEEADTLYNFGALAEGSFNFNKAQPQHFGFVLAYALGNVVTTAAGAGYQHVITPIDGDVDDERSLPTFTAAQRFGKTIMFRRIESLAIDQFTAKFSKDSFVELTTTLKGTGKVTNSVEEEDVTAARDTTVITLAANDVAGDTAAERVDAIHQLQVELETDVWTDVTDSISVVSNATPANISLSAAVSAETSNATWKVLYAPDEVPWMTFPARVSESPMRVSQVEFVLGGTWDGSDFQGGRELDAEVESIEYTCSNNLQVEFTLGGVASCAGRIFRDGRDQVLKLNREFRDYILQNLIDQNRTLGARILVEGAEFDTGQKYTVEIVFPKLGILTADLAVNGKRLAEAGDLKVLEDDTYGSVIATVKNLVSGYAA